MSEKEGECEDWFYIVEDVVEEMRNKNRGSD